MLEAVSHRGIFDALNRFYGLNVKVGQRVVANGTPGEVVGIAPSGAMHIAVKLDSDGSVGYWHPTWEMQYVESDGPPGTLSDANERGS